MVLAGSPLRLRGHVSPVAGAAPHRRAEVQSALAAAEQRVLCALDAEQQATLHALLQQVTANTAQCTKLGIA